MDPNSELRAINDEHTRAIAVMALIYAGEFDHHLTRILGAITRRMSTPEFQHYRPPTMAAANNGRNSTMSESDGTTPVEVTPDHVQVDLPRVLIGVPRGTEEEAEQPPRQVIVTQLSWMDVDRQQESAAQPRTWAEASPPAPAAEGASGE